ncbi:tyrosine-type recombinase/integrase [Azohydromonas australica]|uniref:tyrosine-type recombinase/integrase n=1 Tax=Azohydromonas australica TaxID=364039 RepID=UPI00040BDFD3|nr:tyrosine-type recombinase/integrase [Azohydromonas australica]
MLKAIAAETLDQIETGDLSAALLELERKRSEAALLFRPAQIHLYGPDQLLEVQRHFGLGDEWGVIDVPAELLAPNQRSETNRIRNYKKICAKENVAPERQHAGVLALVRYQLLLFAAPCSPGGVTRYFLKPSSILAEMNRMQPLVRACIRNPAAKEHSLLTLLTEQEYKACAHTPALWKTFRATMSKLRDYGARGYWLDIPPKIGTESNPPKDAAGVAIENPRRGSSEELVQPIPEKGQGHTPLPDLFVTEAGYRSYWMMREMGPSLLKVANGFIDIAKRFPAHTSHAKSKRAAAQKEFLKNFVWKDASGSVITKLPFKIRAVARPSRPDLDREIDWPPKNADQMQVLWTLLQTSHLFIVLLSIGGRISESLSLAPGCLSETRDGIPLANGRTYKLYHKFDGQKRDWPLPPEALEAIRQQEELTHVCAEMGGPNDIPTPPDRSKAGMLWNTIGKLGYTPLTAPNRYLQFQADYFGLSDLLEGDTITPHRFRKTIARLIALAVVGAPKILMDLFDHKTIEMTLHYILTDPEVRAELTKVAKEQTIMFNEVVEIAKEETRKIAENAIRDAQNYGGPAVTPLKAAVKAERARLGRQLGAADIRDLADLLTLDRQHWMYVRPGVICTKLPGQAGPCNLNLGEPEPSRCRSHCEMRLEEAWLMQDVDGSVEDSVRYYEIERAAGNEYVAEMWAGQILTHVRRFDAVFEKWKNHPVVAQLLEGSTEKVA